MPVWGEAVKWYQFSRGAAVAAVRPWGCRAGRSLPCRLNWKKKKKRLLCAQPAAVWPCRAGRMRLLWEARGGWAGPATVAEELEIFSDVRRPSSLCASNQTTTTPSSLYWIEFFLPLCFFFPLQISFLEILGDTWHTKGLLSADVVKWEHAQYYSFVNIYK